MPTVDLTANDSDRRLRLLGTQPTVPDPPTNMFSFPEEVDSQVEGANASETDESDTESLVDREFVAAVRPDPVRFEVLRI